MANKNLSAREQLEHNVEIRLGGGNVLVELKHESYKLAVDRALRIYRQYSSNALEEAMLMFTLKKGEQIYYLPKEVVLVKKIYRQALSRTWGNTTVTSNSMARQSPLMLGGPWNIYQMGGLGGGLAGQLTIFELYSDYLKVSGKMFGSEMPVIWNDRQHKMTLSENIAVDEDVVIHIFKDEDEDLLINDRYAGVWLEDWAFAEACEMLGRARRKFGNLPGPNGNTTMDGETLIQEANAMKTDLMQQLKHHADSSEPLGFIIG